MRIIGALIAVIMVIYTTLVTSPLTFADNQEEIHPIEITYEKQVHLEIAHAAVNRINFGSFRVIKIIGNINGFNNTLSDSGSDLFIVPTLPAGEKIDFSALLSSGYVIDFSLTVVRSKKPYLVKLKLPSKLPLKYKSEVVKMIEAMSSGTIGKYYVQNSLQKLSSNISIPINTLLSSKIKIIAQDSYRYGDLFGVSLNLQNLSNVPCYVTADDLVDTLRLVAAVWIEKEHLPSKAKTKAFLVFKGAGE